MTTKKQKTPQDADVKSLALAPILFAGLIRDTDLVFRLGHTSPRTMRRWFSRGKGPAAIRIGKSLFYRELAVQKWLESIEQAPKARRRSLKRETAAAEAFA
jgi:hypothetical protein